MNSSSSALSSAPAPHPAVEVVIPVYNERDDLERNVRRLRMFLDDHFPFSASITIADNASTDGTWRIAEGLTEKIPGVQAVHLAQKGRGRALRTVWSTSLADVVAYMDVDLSTDLAALLPLVAPLVSGHSDVAIGSRLARGAHVTRGPKREIISRCYNLLLKAGLGSRFSDAQCGFKAVRGDVARTLVPAVVDDEWFFDTELLVLAERNGLRIHEVPVDWVDDADSRVDIVRTALDDLKGMWRMMRLRWSGRDQLLRVAGLRREAAAFAARSAGQETAAPPSQRLRFIKFAAVGVLNTAIMFAVFNLCALWLGMSAEAANVIGWTAGFLNSFHWNRMWTFADRRDLPGGRVFVRFALTNLVALAVSMAVIVAGQAGISRLSLASSLPEAAALNAIEAAAIAAALVVNYTLSTTWAYRATRPLPSMSLSPVTKWPSRR
jgi:putative flippase GtrA